MFTQTTASIQYVLQEHPLFINFYIRMHTNIIYPITVWPIRIIHRYKIKLKKNFLA